MKYSKIYEVLANGHPSSQMYALEHDIEIMYKPAYIIVTSSLISSHFVITVTMKWFFLLLLRNNMHTQDKTVFTLMTYHLAIELILLASVWVSNICFSKKNYFK